MVPSSPPRASRLRRLLLRLALAVVVLASIVAAVIYLGPRWVSSSDTTETLTHTAGEITLKVTVTERGNLESQKTVAGTCELEDRENKIIFIVEEGSTVEKDDVVVRFDRSKIDKEIVDQEIAVNRAKKESDAAAQEVEVQKNKGESEIAQADMELKLAELDLTKYKEGDYLVKLNELRGKIALAEFELDTNKDAYRHLAELVKSGFREPEQLQGAKQKVKSAEFNLQRDKETLRVLEKYDHERSLTEFEGKAKEAVRKVERAKSSSRAQELKTLGNFESAKAQLKMQEKRLEDLNEQLTKCEIKASQNGMVAYSNRRWYGDDQRIREGATVHHRQVIFNLPDMSSMQVKVNVHESVVKKVANGQKAIIRVDAFPDLTLEGTVQKVSPLADSTNPWARGGVKEYATIVSIDKMPEVALRPGMTAEVEIKVGEFPKVVAVPVQAVTEKGRRHFVFVDTNPGFERRAVKIGQSNHKFVQIKSGLNVGQRVALDARVRAAATEDDEEGEEPLPDELEEETDDEPTDVMAVAEPASDASDGDSSDGDDPSAAVAADPAIDAVFVPAASVDPP